ncbi:MAG: SusF/SusE family outer membrane protein [Bacteroidales bacterium]|nr:SusF/SusE family outer membrane protein [Bacteroidales bacterium]
MGRIYFRWLFALISLLLTTVSASAQREFYIIGLDNQWNTDIASAVLYETSEGSNIYENEVEFQSQWFFFAEQLTENPNDWEGLEQYAYGPEHDSDPLFVNGCSDLYNPRAGAFKIDRVGTFKVTIDMNTKTVFVGDDNFVRPTTFGKEIYIVGTENAWSLESPQATLAQTEEEGVYSGVVNFKGISEFKILPSTDSWTVNYGTSMGFVTDAVGNDNHLTQNGSNIPIFKGSYEITVDMKRLRLNMKLLDEQREMYILGNDNVWNCNEAGAVLKETAYNSNIYVGKNITFAGEWFGLFDLLSNDWEVVNSYRFAPVGDPKITPTVEKVLELNTESFQIEPGTYDVTVDMNKMTILVAPVGWVAPNTIYMVGSSKNWSPSDPIATLYEDNDNKGVFVGEFTFDDTTQFKFITILGSWEVNYGMYGTEVPLSTPIAIYQNGDNFELPAGQYSVTLDTNESFVTFYAAPSSSVDGLKVNTEGDERVFDIGGVRLGKVNGKRIVIVNGKKIVK